MTAAKPLVDPETGEPLRMGARVKDRDGHTWERRRTMWVCLAPVGTEYFDRAARRMRTITRVGRLPWRALQRDAGPVEVLDLNAPAAS